MEERKKEKEDCIRMRNMWRNIQNINGLNFIREDHWGESVRKKNKSFENKLFILRIKVAVSSTIHTLFRHNSSWLTVLYGSSLHFHPNPCFLINKQDKILQLGEMSWILVIMFVLSTIKICYFIECLEASIHKPYTSRFCSGVLNNALVFTQPGTVGWISRKVYAIQILQLWENYRNVLEALKFVKAKVTL